MADPSSLDKGLGAFLAARLDPSPANIDRFVGYTKAKENESDPHVLAFVTQAFGAFHRIDDVFQWLDRMPASAGADVSYVLFRPTVAEVRRDPRFMRVAKRIGLVDYWQSSGQWPDFCSDPSLPYDCRKVAASLI